MVPTAIQAVVLGIVQGLTEFIPVSSSGHLQLIPQIFGWSNPSTSFILFLHFGTLLALVMYFRGLIWSHLKSLLNWVKHRGQLHDKTDRRNVSVAWRIMLAILPAGILGLLLDKTISSFYDVGGAIPNLIIVTTMAIFGVIFIFSDKFFTGKKIELEKLSWQRTLIIGFSQALAFIRGVSRSGMTLISGQAVGLNRVDAAEFSFFVSIPIIAGAVFLDVLDFVKLPAEQMQAELVPNLIGIVTSFVFGYIAIRFLMNYLKHKGLAIFGWYRIIFAIVALILLS